MTSFWFDQQQNEKEKDCKLDDNIYDFKEEDCKLGLYHDFLIAVWKL